MSKSFLDNITKISENILNYNVVAFIWLKKE